MVLSGRAIAWPCLPASLVPTGRKRTLWAKGWNGSEAGYDPGTCLTHGTSPATPPIHWPPCDGGHAGTQTLPRGGWAEAKEEQQHEIDYMPSTWPPHSQPNSILRLKRSRLSASPIRNASIYFPLYSACHRQVRSSAFAPIPTMASPSGPQRMRRPAGCACVSSRPPPAHQSSPVQPRPIIHHHNIEPLLRLHDNGCRGTAVWHSHSLPLLTIDTPPSLLSSLSTGAGISDLN